MNKNTLMGLGIATALVALAGFLVLRKSETAVAGRIETTKLFPELSASINEVEMIRFQRKDTSYTLQRKGDGWGLVEKSGYPVEIEQVRKFLIALDAATVIESKTSDPERYAKLGVQDPTSEGATSTLVTLVDKSGKELAKLVIGKEHEGKGGLPAGQTYVRRVGEAQSLLAKDVPALKEKDVDWLAKEILKLTKDRIRSVEIDHPDGEVVHSERGKPDDQNFELANIPEGKELQYPTVASSMSSTLEYLNLEDVAPVAKIDFTTNPGPIAHFTTFDGLTLNVQTKDEGEKTWARFDARYEAPAQVAPPPPEEPKDDATKAAEAKPAKKTPEDVQKEVESLNSKLKDWAFQIPTYNKPSFTKHMKDLVKDKAPPPPPPGAEGAKPGDTPGGDKGTYKLPGDLPPEILEQIKQHQESLGHKIEVAPPKNPDGDPKPETDSTTPPKL